LFCFLPLYTEQWKTETHWRWVLWKDPNSGTYYREKYKEG
jgi:hypothetical protein